MAKSKAAAGGSANAGAAKAPRSLAIASAGIATGGQFASLMSALMSDVIEGAVSPGVANAAVNAGGKLLKAVELQIKFGQAQANGDRVLRLVAQDVHLVDA